MAKHSISKSGGTSRFRMVVIDAELQEGEISQLAQAIQGAFGAQRVTSVRVNGSATRSLPSSDLGEISGSLDAAEDELVVDDAGTEVVALTPAKPRAQKKLRTPNLDNEVNP